MSEITNRQRRLKLDMPVIDRLVSKTLAMEKIDGSVSIVFAGRRLMAKLNRQYFGKSGSTDVIAFPLQDDIHQDTGYLGEVVVCSGVAADAAAERGVDAEDELYLYTVHGILHLLGYTDDTPAKRTRMNNRARRIVQAFFKTEKKSIKYKV